MSVLQKLTEGIVKRDVSKEGAALRAKWEKTGLLEGLKDERTKDGMAVLLENQAKQLLSEASSMSVGADVEGFASVAFPIVRRVFGGLIAQDLVSVQPMSLPSGLIFFLDFTYTDTIRAAGAVAGQSVYGGGRVASQLTGGLNLTGYDTTNDIWNLETGPWSLNNAYSAPTGSVNATLTLVAVRTGSTNIWATDSSAEAGQPLYYAKQDALVNFDPDLSGSIVGVYTMPASSFTNLDVDNLMGIHCTGSSILGAGYAMVRRVTQYDPVSGSSRIMVAFATDPDNSNSHGVHTATKLSGSNIRFTYPVKDNFNASTAVGSVVGATPWGLEGAGSNNATLSGTGTNADIPELDIKVDSVSVTAQTRKLKAKWTPELGQDLNAYHNLDAEVELTSILSEHIALEIDQEILVDLIQGATAETYYWSRSPGKFVNKKTGVDVTANGANLPDFTGTVSEWYETLIEQINDVSAQIHRKTLRGGANFIVCSPEVASLLEFTSGFRANVTVDDDKGIAGAVKVGTVSKKWDVYVDPYFPRNVVLVGRKGQSFLESGYIYAPYVPMQTTPTIFGTEDFVPRKGVMTRYAKKMVRPDCYGLVIIGDLIID